MTLKEIAEQTGYSIATVSRVLNGTGYNEQSKTYAAITKFAQEHGYTRVSRSGNVVAMVVPDIGNPITTAIAKTVQQICRDSGLFLILAGTSGDVKEQTRVLQSLSKMELYGLICSPLALGAEESLQDFAALRSGRGTAKLPVVLLSGDLPLSAYDSVGINNVAGAFDATCHLLKQGLTDIAVIAPPQASKPGRERVEGFCKAYRFFNLAPPAPARIRYGDFSAASGYAQARAILQSGPLPQAIFPMSNLITRGCLRAMTDAGVPISGGPIQLISFDGDEMLDIVAPDTPYVSRPIEELGRVAMNLLITRAERGSKETAPIQRIELNPVLKVPGKR